MGVEQRLGRWLVVTVVVAAAIISAFVIGTRQATTTDAFPVTGQFVLWDDFPANQAGDLCNAKRSLYYDINSSTAVRAESQDGVDLAATTLGDGRILTDEGLAEQLRIDATDVMEFRRSGDAAALQPCLFTFGFELEAGSDNGAGYVVLLGNRGRWQMSEDQLRVPGALQWSLGMP